MPLAVFPIAVKFFPFELSTIVIFHLSRRHRVYFPLSARISKRQTLIPSKRHAAWMGTREGTLLTKKMGFSKETTSIQYGHAINGKRLK